MPCRRFAGCQNGTRRIAIAVSPGISALQAAAARSGAPLGHDFCTISLSDLLTPWDMIQRRVRAAAEGDFVIAFYNPVSKKRRTQLAFARDVLLEHRPATTPVILATNLGREGELIRIVPLGSLNVDDVDMLTVVVVGSSNSSTKKATLPAWSGSNPRQISSASFICPARFGWKQSRRDTK